MRDIRPTLRAEASQVAEWLEAHADDWPPIRVVSVESRIQEDIDDDWAIDLTVVLEDPPEPRKGWANDALWALIDAANVYSRTLENAMHVFVMPVTASSRAA